MNSVCSGHRVGSARKEAGAEGSAVARVEASGSEAVGTASCSSSTLPMRFAGDAGGSCQLLVTAKGARRS